MKNELEARRNQALTAADQLRDNLERLEILIGTLGRATTEETLSILTLLDEATETLHSLQAKGGSFNAEEVLLKSLYAQFDHKGGSFLSAIGGAAALRTARAAAAPPPERWWWYIDERVAARRKAQLLRFARYALIAAVALVIAGILYNRFLAPDPAVRAKMDHLNNADQLITEQNFQGALNEVEQALVVLPNDQELLVLKGVLEQKLGQTDAAAATFSAAQGLAGNQESFLLLRVQQYIRLGQLDAAQQDIASTLAVNPNSAVAYYFKGVIASSLGNSAEAMDSLSTASTLAASAGDTQLEALARVQMAQIAQFSMMPDQSTVQPTATPSN